MKKYIILLLVILIVMQFMGCSKRNGPDTPGSTTPDTSDPANVPEEWEIMNASFACEGSSQYDNATLMMKYLSNSCALFEFRLMEGSEAEDLSFDTILSGVLIIDKNGTGVYETLPDAENSFSINFALSEDGQTVDVTHNGTLEISPDGKYLFVESQIEVSETSVGENGIVTAAGVGETEIKCVVTCEDGVSNISVPIYVTSELEYDTVIP